MALITVPEQRLEQHASYRQLLASDVLERSSEELTSLIEQHRMDNPSLRVPRHARGAVDARALVERLAAPPDSLPEHLLGQLRLRVSDARERALAAWLIGNLERDGYLREPLDELAARVDASLAELERALALVQSLEPVGVGARSLAECLLLQLQSEAPSDAVAIQIARSHLKLLAAGREAELAARLDVSLERVRAAIRAIRRLEPRPGRPFGAAAAAPVVRPELAIVRADDGYAVVVPEDEELPSLRGDGPRGAGPHDEPLVHQWRWQWRRASCLIDALAQRRRTLRLVGEAIVARQHAFLDEGPAHLRPLALAEVAAATGLHPSTVSRAVANRYVDTPHGILPLRRLFATALPRDPERELSPARVQERIRALVRAEDPGLPRTDGELTSALADEGILIARRTVAKYREALGIAPSWRRRPEQGPAARPPRAWGWPMGTGARAARMRADG